MDFNKFANSENASSSEISDAFARRFSLPLLSEVQSGHRFIGLSNLRRTVFLTFDRFRKMASLGARHKRDYEDLDNTCDSSVESVQRNPQLFSLGSPPAFFQSDSAINVKTPRQYETNLPINQDSKCGLGNSIPCFLRQDRSHSFCTLPQEFPGKNIQKQSTFSYYNLRRRANFWLFAYVCFYIAYLIIGTFCIEGIEKPIEQSLRQNYTAKRDEFLLKYPDISGELEEFVKFVIAAHDIGITILDEYQNETNWKFGQSLFFSTSLVTTIGYGHITPKSHLGKMFCIIFSAIGIPLTLVLFSAIVQRLLTPSNYLLQILIEKFNSSQKLFTIRLFHLFIMGSLVFVIFYAIPIWILVYLEKDWTILDAFYFCFISLTTIGLGDFIPGETVRGDNESIYKVIFSVYLLIGLIGMMLVLTVFYEIHQLNIGLIFMPIKNEEKNIEPPEMHFQRTKSTRRALSVPS